jgi:hypothetical protein
MANRSIFLEPENLVGTSWHAYVTWMWAVVQGSRLGEERDVVAPGSSRGNRAAK